MCSILSKYLYCVWPGGGGGGIPKRTYGTFSQLHIQVFIFVLNWGNRVMTEMVTEKLYCILKLCMAVYFVFTK